MSITCPKCHRPFTKELEGEKLLAENEGEEKRIDAMVGNRPMLGMSRITGATETTSVHTIDLTYEDRFKCKHCGHEWTELKTKEGEVKEK